MTMSLTHQQQEKSKLEKQIFKSDIIMHKKPNLYQLTLLVGVDEY